MEVNKIILMEVIDNLVEFDGIFQTTGFCIEVNGTIVDYIMLAKAKLNSLQVMSLQMMMASGRC